MATPAQLLAIDIGNTSIHAGLFDRGRLRRAFSLPTALVRRPGRLRARLAGGAGRLHEAIVCSVVPWATPRMVRALRAAGCPRVRIVGHGLRVPLKNRYRYPKEVGQDRLVGAYAAWREFGGNRERGTGRDCIVVDLGTAITIDIVTRKGEYLGGVIAPGIDISLEALATRTALLPRVVLKTPPEPLGRDTANSIRSGLLYGCAALCDGLVERLRARYAPKAIVVATGGSCRLVSRHTRTLERLRPNLVLQGLHSLSLK